MADSNGRGAALDPTTGIQTGGDNQHRHAADILRFARLAAPAIVRAIGPLGRADALATIPPGNPTVGDPRITHAFRETASSVVLTIAHDAGTDLVVPLLAAAGQGFLVIDRRDSAIARTLRLAARPASGSTQPHLRLTLASPLSNPSASCRLFYPYGSYSPAGLPAYTALPSAFGHVLFATGIWRAV